MVGKLWEKGYFVMGDVDLQVELTLNEKEILIVTCMVTELVYLVQVLPRRGCFNNNSLQLLKTVLSETKNCFPLNREKKLVATQSYLQVAGKKVRGVCKVHELQ